MTRPKQPALMAREISGFGMANREVNARPDEQTPVPSMLQFTTLFTEAAIRTGRGRGRHRH